MEKLLQAIKYFFERRAFGVCSFLGQKWGISSERIRIYFIYTSFFTFGSPFIIYLVAMFWMNIKKYLVRDKFSVLDL